MLHSTIAPLWEDSWSHGLDLAISEDKEFRTVLKIFGHDQNDDPDDLNHRIF